MKLACMLAAAGFASRYDADKLLLSVDGRPMGIRAVDILINCEFALKVLVTSADKQYLIESARQAGFSVVINPEPRHGLSSSVRLGTEYICRAGTFKGILYAVADQPNLRLSTMKRLIKAFNSSPDYIWALEANGKRGNPVIFPHSLFKELLQIQGDRGGRQVISAHTEMLRTVIAESSELMDIDTREDAEKCLPR